ncbi:acyltransferase family protein [Cohnella hashimotonis]|uniref:Acyltransferase family protein n=1 Tax=Cohnella hashimotonis TaxID=2826895 RepID=A0ABT6TH77_9BACL|nr:acyltransferase family protein [Cohnella hashimotonis]MDI4646070.1 acyltransferase family protein [Cohnella hashimotonis]
MHTTKSAPSRYMPGLDGLRAIAVIAVIAYHLDFDWASGGLLGVGVFFVLSGYLITDQIASELNREGRLNLKGFWLRRARRLLPAMLLVMAAVLLYLLLFDRDRLPSLAGDVWSAVTYTSNWYLIFHHVSYFESFGPPSPFGHLWSLAVEEQFYLLWPLLLPAAAMLLGRRGRTALAITAAAVVSAVLMAVLYVPGEDPSRIYYGTDTRAFGLLLGAALALVWPSGRLSTGLSRRSRAGLDAIGIAALAAVLLMIRCTSEYDSFLYRGGLVLLSLCAAALVAVLAHPDSRFGAWLGCGPMRWIGKRSYGIYLWHYPVIVLSEKQVNTDGPEPLRIALQLAVSVILAALSYRFVENPIRRRGLAAVREGALAVAASLSRGLTPRGSSAPSRPAAGLSVAALILLCVSCTGDAHPLGQGGTAAASEGAAGIIVDAGIHAGAGKPSGSAEAAAGGGGRGDADVRPAQGHADTAEPTAKPTSTPTPKPPAGGKPSAKPGHSPSPSPKPSDSPAPQQSADAGANAGTGSEGEVGKRSGEGITVIGDSVMLNVKPYLEQQLPGIVVDGEVGRQMREAPDRIAALKSQGLLGSRIVVELGTNGSFTKKQLTKLLDALAEEDEVILMNTRVPRKWQDTVNDMLNDIASDYPNVSIGDWYGASADHDEYFGKDGVHLGKTGSQAYAKLVADLLGSKLSG